MTDKYVKPATRRRIRQRRIDGSNYASLVEKGHAEMLSLKENNEKADALKSKISAVQQQAQRKARPVELVRDVNNFYGGLLSIVSPNTVSDEISSGNKYSRIVSVTSGWLLRKVSYHPEISTSGGWGSITVYPEHWTDGVLTAEGDIFTKAITPNTADIYIAKAASHTSVDRMFDLDYEAPNPDADIVRSFDLHLALDVILGARRPFNGKSDY